MTDYAISREYWSRLRGTCSSPVVPWMEEEEELDTESGETNGVVLETITEDRAPPDTPRHTFSTLNYLWALMEDYLF